MDEYFNKLFEQVKNDLGYKDLDIKLKIEKLKDGSFKTFKEHRVNGRAAAVNKEIIIYPKTSSKYINALSQRENFGTMFHEWKHIKQAETAYRTNPKKLVDSYVENLETHHPDFIEKVMKENKQTRTQAIQDIRKDLSKTLDSLFSKYTKLTPNAPEYKKGLEYIECVKNNIEYSKRITEIEAFNIGAKAKEIYNYIANPWGIF